MAKRWKGRGWWLSLAVWVTIGESMAGFSNHALAQIIPDTTLGTETSVIVPNTNVRGVPADRIEGGAVRGVNLFHSFSDFNVGEGLQVYFSNPSGIENILTRVTGNTVSNILGTLGVDGGANLFLLNPNGIVFAANARLDIAGSFVASTANGVVFDNGFSFSANNPEAPPLLTINVPLGLQYGSNQAGTITNRGNLSVGQNLALLAGSVTSTGQLAAPAGQLTVEAVAGDTQVRDVTAQTAILFANDNLILEESQLRTTGDLRLLAQNTVRVRDSVANPFVAMAGGNLYIQGNKSIDILALNHLQTPFQSGGNLTLVSDGNISGDAHFSSTRNFQILNLSGSTGNFISLYDPIIRSNQDVTFGNYTGAALKVEAMGNIRGGDITINSPDTSGNIPTTDPDFTTLTTTRALILRAGLASVASPNVPQLGVGGTNFTISGSSSLPGGSIQVGNLNTSSVTSDGGSIILSAVGNIITGNINSSSSVGNGGSISLNSTAGMIDTSQGAAFFTTGSTPSPVNILSYSSAPNRTGGAIAFTAYGNITTAGMGSFGTGAGTNATANGGSIFLSSSLGSINTSRGPLISNTGSGSAGTVIFNAYGDIVTADITATSLTGSGNRISLTSTLGEINTRAGFLNTSSGDGNGAALEVSAFGDITTGQVWSFSNSAVAGKVRLDSKAGRIDTSGGSILSGTISGIPGDVMLSAERDIVTGSTITTGGTIEFTSGAAINTQAGKLDASSFGNGGRITLNANGNITTSQIDSSSTFANGGQINLISRDGSINTSAGSITSFADYSGKDGGQITLTAQGDITPGDIDSSGGFFGAGGVITLTSHGKISVSNHYISSETYGTGKGGDINITASSLNLRDKALLSSSTFGSGQAGNLTISTGQLTVENGAKLGAVTAGAGQGGNLTVTASDLVELSGTESGLFTTNQAGTGNAGDLMIDTRQLIVRDGAGIYASTRGAGNAGNLLVKASDSVQLIGTSSYGYSSGLFSESFAGGNAGNLTIDTERLIVRDGAIASVGTESTSQGRGGNLTVNALESVELSGTSTNGELFSSLITAAKGSQEAGNLTINTSRLTLRDGGLVLASTLGPGRGGDLTVNASDVVEVLGTATDDFPSALSTDTGGTGQAGDLTVNTRQLVIRDGGRVGASTFNNGNAGTLTVKASEWVELSGTSGRGRASSLSTSSGVEGIPDNPLVRDSGLQLDPTVATGRGGDLKITTDQLIVRDRAAVTAATFGQGTGGNIQVQANSLALTNGAQVSAATSGSGRAGDISVQEADTIALNNSSISTSVNAGAVGQGGKIDLQTRSLFLDNGAQVSAATSGKGPAGNISVRDADAVSLTNSAISTAVNVGAVGQGGDIDIQTRSLSVRDQSRISANTSGEGKAGSITVTGNTLEATNGGQLLTSTASGEDAGNINLTLQDDVKLTGEGTGIFANTTPGSTGNGGSISLDARTLLLRDGAGIAVGSQGAGQGGNITAQSNSTTLDNRAFISAKTASNTGGNITLGVQDILLLRRGSEISTTAGTALSGGDGGNITISAGFILGIPKENSDITANAFTGRGGNINITTQGIFGLQFRPRLTPLSDITASSEFGLNGSVQIITPGVDPNRGLAELPTDLVDATGLIDRRCVPGAGTEQSSSFTITGRGGLPPNPHETLGEEGLLEDLGTPVGVSTGTRGGQPRRASASPSSPPQPLVEAQGWVFAPDGTVILTAQAPTATPQHPWQTPASCQTLSPSSDAPIASPR